MHFESFPLCMLNTCESTTLELPSCSSTSNLVVARDRMLSVRRFKTRPFQDRAHLAQSVRQEKGQEGLSLRLMGIEIGIFLMGQTRQKGKKMIEPRDSMRIWNGHNCSKTKKTSHLTVRPIWFHIAWNRPL